LVVYLFSIRSFDTVSEACENLILYESRLRCREYLNSCKVYIRSAGGLALMAPSQFPSSHCAYSSGVEVEALDGPPRDSLYKA